MILLRFAGKLSPRVFAFRPTVKRYLLTCIHPPQHWQLQALGINLQIFKAVPTNIITGALGVGKTTLIQGLLAQKPANERWAVLINEFGEIGMDAALLHTRNTRNLSHSSDNNITSHEIFVREVPGGCMCCTSGITMQIALNQLLAQAKPHRVLIEPTGLGHPKEVIQILGSEYYRDVIKLENTLCLVDARKLANDRWRTHPTFKEQFEVADQIVVTKSDLYEGDELSQLDAYLNDLHISEPTLTLAIKGNISLCVLDKSLVLSSLVPLAGKFKASMQRKVGVNQIVQARTDTPNLLALENKKNQNDVSSEEVPSIIRNEKDSEGFYSRGWRWPAEHWFDYAEVIELIESIDVVRLKAIMITIKGIYSFNMLDGEIQIQEHDEAFDSRLEFIAASELSATKAEQSVENFIEAISA